MPTAWQSQDGASFFSSLQGEPVVGGTDYFTQETRRLDTPRPLQVEHKEHHAPQSSPASFNILKSKPQSFLQHPAIPEKPIVQQSPAVLDGKIEIRRPSNTTFSNQNRRKCGSRKRKRSKDSQPSNSDNKHRERRGSPTTDTFAPFSGLLGTNLAELVTRTATEATITQVTQASNFISKSVRDCDSSEKAIPKMSSISEATVVPAKVTVPFDPNKYGNPRKKPSNKSTEDDISDTTTKLAKDGQMHLETLKASAPKRESNDGDLTSHQEAAKQPILHSARSESEATQLTTDPSQGDGVALCLPNTSTGSKTKSLRCDSNKSVVALAHSPQGRDDSLNNTKDSTNDPEQAASPSNSLQNDQAPSVESEAITAQEKSSTHAGPQPADNEVPPNSSPLDSKSKPTAKTPLDTPAMVPKSEGIPNESTVNLHPRPPDPDPKKTERENHLDYLKWYRTLSPADKLKVQQRLSAEVIAKMAEKNRESSHRDTTSLATLRSARLVPNLEEANMPPSTHTSHGDSTSNSEASTFANSLLKEVKHLSSAGPSVANQSSSNGVKSNEVNTANGTGLNATKSFASPRLVTPKPSPLRNETKVSPPNANVNGDIKGGAAEKKSEQRTVTHHSNAWGSDPPSEGHSSEAPDKPSGYGKLFRYPHEEPCNLANWDGGFAPPPFEWNSRPAFNNNDTAFRKHFDNWLSKTTLMTLGKVGDPDKREIIPSQKLMSFRLCPDGLDLVLHTLTINSENCHKYGYGYDAPQIIQTFSRPLDPKDLEDWGKVDMQDALNAQHNHETAVFLTNNYNGHKLMKEKQEEISIQHLRDVQLEGNVALAAIEEERARANIYVRPAVRADIPQLVDIYNFYVENSPRTTETRAIGREEMMDRFNAADEDKLPFLVALSKRLSTRRNKKGQFQEIQTEQIVGYALAQDFSGKYLAERLTSELELYVHPEFGHRGVGRCLLDKLLLICDAGYSQRENFYFNCDRQVSHLYGPGGQRDLLTLIFVIRHYANDLPEDNPDYPWIKKWLGRYGFEEQGCLKHCSVKHRRHANMGYLVRRTFFSSLDGYI